MDKDTVEGSKGPSQPLNTSDPLQDACIQGGIFFDGLGPLREDGAARHDDERGLYHGWNRGRRKEAKNVKGGPALTPSCEHALMWNGQ